MKVQVIDSERSKTMAHRMIDQLPEDGKWKVEVKRAESRRTLAQNRLYWLWVNTIADASGHRIDEIHQALKASFLVPITTVDFKTGEVKELIPTTTTMKVSDMTAYLERIDEWAHQYGIPLVHPDDDYNLAMGIRHAEGSEEAEEDGGGGRSDGDRDETE